MNVSKNPRYIHILSRILHVRLKIYTVIYILLNFEVMILKSIRSFRASLTIAIVLITILMGVGAALSVPNIAYSQSIPFSVPSSDINPANDKAVILTFDDGYKSQYTNAKPILDKYGYKATFYIVCNNVGANGYLSWEDITVLYKEGYNIGSHTMNHKDLSKLSKKMVDFEVGESKQ